MSQYILSTMTASVNYNLYGKVENLPILKHKITIHGGAGIPSARSGFGEVVEDENTGRPIWTADGIITPVSDSDWEILKENKVFQKHLAKNLVKVLNSDIRGNHRAIQKHAKDMSRDGFALLDKSNVGSRMKIMTAKPEKDNGYQL